VSAAGSLEAQLRELDLALDEAVSERDGATLERLLAEDFIYTHAGGTSEGKRDFIQTVVARADPPRRALSALEVEPHGDVAVTRAIIEFVYHDGRPNLYLEYVRVHRLSGDRWLAISHHSFYPGQGQA
jgi:ketosteroid isomerase-like protein